MRWKQRGIYWLFLLPSLLGVLLFYVVPFGYSLWYALIDNMGARKFVGLKNFTDTLTNSLFQSAAYNSAVFMVISVPLGMAVALLLSLCLQKMKRGRVPAIMALLLPLVVPSGTIVYFWKVLFDNNGLFDRNHRFSSRAAARRSSSSSTVRSSSGRLLLMPKSASRHRRAACRSQGSSICVHARNSKRAG